MSLIIREDSDGTFFVTLTGEYRKMWTKRGLRNPLREWMATHMQGKWTFEVVESKSLGLIMGWLEIQDRRDAMVFKLRWS